MGGEQKEEGGTPRRAGAKGDAALLLLMLWG
jgi:hypothetical protein